MSSDEFNRISAFVPPRYRLTREIGRGASSSVYLAHDLAANREVVIKVLLESLTASTSAERFRRESRRLGQLLHPGLLPLLDAGEANGRCFFVSPFVPGETLRQHLDRERQLTVSETIGIGRQIAATLEYLHGQDVVHRDLKPENIYLTNDGRALVLDFGLAKLTEESESGEVSLTAAGVSVGTPQYMSPEQHAGDARIDRRADLYALGCVLYEMLAGEPPFTASTRQAIARMHLTQQPRSLRVFRPGLPEAVERVILQLLAKAPADRFDDARALSRALDSATVSSSSAPPPGRRRLRLVGMLGAVMVVALTVWWLGTDRGTATRDTRLSAPVRIALLPFEDGTREGDYGWLALGLTRELSDALTGVSALNVITPESVNARTQDAPTADSLGRLLDCRILISGSVDRLGSQARATIRVRDVREGSSIGAPLRLAVPKDSIDELRVLLRDSVAAILRINLGRHFQLRPFRSARASAKALEHLEGARDLREMARQRYSVRDEPAVDRLLDAADSTLNLAAQEEPAWDEPLVMRGWLADSRVSMEIDRHGGACMAECRAWIDETRRSAERSLARNSRSPRALTLHAAARLRAWDWLDSSGEHSAVLDSAIREVRQALSMNPSDARALLVLASALQRKGEFAESAEAIERALRSDPWFEEVRIAYSRQFFAFLRDARVREASRLCEQGRRLLADVRGFRECRLSLLGWYGRGRLAVDSAWRELAAVEGGALPPFIQETWSYRRAMVAALLARSGLAESARAVLRRTSRDARARHANVDFEQAFVLLAMGDTTGTLAALGRFITNRPQRRAYVREHTWFRGLQQHPGFQLLVGSAR